MEQEYPDKETVQRLQGKLEQARQKITILERMVEARTKELYLINGELESRNKELEQFVYLASHDLQEPLRTVSNFVGLILEKHTGKFDPDIVQYLDFIAGATARMQNLIRDLLDYSRVGKNITFGPVDCNVILHEVLSELGASIKASQASISYPELPVVNGNATRLRQLFQNLISNAIKFRKKDSTTVVVITVNEYVHEYVIAVNDNGIGISERDFNKVFIIFQRLNNAQEYPGTGIGLAICKKIVEQHGGRIWLESQLGIGSTFYFSIPKEVIS